jgi:MFS family permease
MIVATVAPTLIGDAADVLGRRPASIVMLALYIISDICLALAEKYSELLGLRVLQAVGVSGKLAEASSAMILPILERMAPYFRLC